MKFKPKTLIVFYSRTGTTKKAAWKILELFKSRKINCDIEEIIDTKDRSGAIGYLFAGKDATLKSLTRIKETKKNPKNYDVVIIGTPVWSFTMSTPIRTYLVKNKNNFKNKSKLVAFFCTQGGSGSERAFRHMEELSGKKPISVLELTTKDVAQNLCGKNVGRFVEKIIR